MDDFHSKPIIRTYHRISIIGARTSKDSTTYATTVDELEDDVGLPVVVRAGVCVAAADAELVDVVTGLTVAGIVSSEKFSEYPLEQVTIGTDPPLRTMLRQV